MQTRPERMERGGFFRAHSACGSSLVVFALLILTACFPGSVRGAAIQGAPAAGAGSGFPFAFADFNGDSRTDVARIQPGNSDSANASDYWVEIRLSGSGSRLIRVIAPSGGLHLEARDVNGDHAVDLVLFTAWLGQPVAILLNDGHGRFRRVEPTDFPDVFRGSKTKWAASTTQTIELICVVQESRTASCVQAGNMPRFGLRVRTVQISNSVFASASFLKFGAERAPPA